MTDEQFRALKMLILEMKVEIKGLALAVRTLHRQIDELATDRDAPDAEIFNTEDNELKARQSLEPRSDSE